MTTRHPLPDAVRKRLAWPLRLTRAGMAAERLTRAFWPVWTILFLLVAARGFDLAGRLPPEAFWAGLAAAALALVVLVARGLRALRWPSRDEALARLDASLPGRPIAALADHPALGLSDRGTSALWQAHLERMTGRVAQARAVEPDLRLSARDPYALRYVGAVALAMALMFGVFWHGPQAAAPVAGAPGAALAGGPAWEGWIEPPAYTGKPTLYLNKITEAKIDIPEGSLVTLHFYGAPGDLPVSQSVADPARPPASDAAAHKLEFEAVQSGTLSITAEPARDWALNVLPDAPPTVESTGEATRKADGRMALPFTARDDHAVTGGTASVELDLTALDRRHGLAPEPESREALVYDLPMPITGKRNDFTETLAEDASEHPWANLPVAMVLRVEDGRGQTGQAEPLRLTLPGRRFFDPVAAAVAEMRRDLLWTRENGARVSQILRAITNAPDGLVRNERAYLMLRVAMKRLDTALEKDFTAEARDEIAAALWEIALLIEDGGLADALERMRQAQERLSEAIRNGASPDEIQKLMDDLKRATDDYIRKLAENMENSTDEPDQRAQNEGQKITGDQIQQMMDEIQRLMEEGRMAEAQELLDQLSRMLENLRVTQGEGGEGMTGPGGQAMRDLQETLRDQQQLSDDAFRDLQDSQPQPGQPQPGDQQGQGQQGQSGLEPQGDGSQGMGQVQPGPEGQAAPQPGDGPQGQDGAQGEGQGGDMAGQLADRQRALRRELDRQRGSLPAPGSEQGDAARQSLDQAGRAMDQAEDALRDGDNARAIERQADAMENLRRGMRALGEALAQQQGDGQGDVRPQAEAQGDRLMPRDPLGRAPGQSGRMGSEENMLQGEDVYRRARDLLDEIRRRTGERSRPLPELDYLKRLLERF